MALFDKFISNIHQQTLFSTKDRLLVATSGGVDSVALCKLCALAGFDFAMAHCNFQLRGSHSDRDEAFVEQFSQSLAAPFFSKKFDTKAYAATNKISTQVAARQLRYEWFETVRQNHHFDYILTAHHADDNVETLLMGFFRGTGIKGLTGIRQKHGKIVRPLLFAKRTELEDFIKEQQLPFVQDESNLQDDYTRNYFRNKLLPGISNVFPEVQDNLIANIDRFKEAETLYRQSVEFHKKKLISHLGEDIHIPILQLEKTPAYKTVLFEILSDYKFSPAQAPAVIALFHSESGRYVQSATHRVIKNRKHLILTPLSEKPASLVIINGEGVYPYANGKLQVVQFPVTNFKAPANPDIACVEASQITFPLILRPWRQGDYFYPLGMPKKKKLSRFFIDRKLSLVEKEKIWVIEANKKIIWIVGHRIDDRVKLHTGTQKVVKISWIRP